MICCNFLVNLLMLVYYFLQLSLQPLIVNALGPVANVSSGIAPVLERSDRIPPAVTISSLVRLAFFSHLLWVLSIVLSL